MKKCAILQSNYIPWKGYFDLIAYVDLFVLYDSVQYTSSDWRNRNRIKTPYGTRWLTIPVRRSRLHSPINTIMVSKSNWKHRHLDILKQAYKGGEHFSEYWNIIETLFNSLDTERLSEINETLIRAICQLLGIKTRIVLDSEFDLSSDRQGRLISICKQAGADIYVSGPAARNYIDESKFKAENLQIEWFDYEGYREYKQLHPPFVHHVTILDLLFNEGIYAGNYLRYLDNQVPESPTGPQNS